MFSRRDCICFFLAFIFVVAGYMLMAFDQTDNGFGPSTLWLAPPLLLAGFFLPVLGIAGWPISLFRKQNGSRRIHLTGLLVFLGTLSVFLLTLEPTASLWDCSEFIACAYKLQIPHTPGTPLALLIGRMFTMFAGDDVSSVAWTLNLMSAIFSSLSVYILYHIIIALGLRVRRGEGNGELVCIVAACVGSLCLAFSDTFWFSAVEAETYGAASFFLLLMVWLIVEGRQLTGTCRNRRLILISYLAGLSYCIHPMCLLALTILPFCWGSVDSNLSVKRSWLLIAAGPVLVFCINRFVAIGVFEFAFSSDRFLVNSFALPFYSGVWFLLLASVFVFRMLLLKFGRMRPFIWSALFLVLGFVPYILLFIRSNHNPPIDESNPEDLAMIKAYMNRESYPTSPVLYGPFFDARIQDVRAKKDIYYKSKTAYRIAGTLPEYVYDSRQTLLPRMYSNDPNNIETYRSWTGLHANEKPDFFDNIRFMVTYQLGHMYFRYLMWNFSGRAGDAQNSTWLWPWHSLDKWRFANARNQYWMIPFLVGLVGAVYHYRCDRRSFISVSILFLITGLILALYLNAPPNEPRERDYIYVGSFIAFCIWIGLGVISLGKKLIGIHRRLAPVVLAMIALPACMLYQNYDDHDRSGRTFQVDHARNTLNACAPNSILFTGGDNDTFPLWYLQEVEGFRTDVRVMVMSYMNTDWYINQLRKSYYDSPAFKLSLTEDDYRQYGPNDVLYVQETIKSPIDVGQFLSLLRSGHPALTMISRNGESYHIIPSRTLNVNVPLPVTFTKTTISPDDAGETVVELQITEDHVSKNLLAILDLLVSNGWERPIHFNFTSLNSLGVDVSEYTVQEGPIYRLRPERNTSGIVAVNAARSYDNIVTNADYENLSDPTVHFSYEDHYARIIVPVRQSFNELARALVSEGDHALAADVLRTAVDKLYQPHLRPSYTNLEAAEILLSLNEDTLADSLSRSAFEYYYRKVSDEGELRLDLDVYLLRRSAELLAMTNHPEYLERISRLKI